MRTDALASPAPRATTRTPLLLALALLIVLSAGQGMIAQEIRPDAPRRIDADAPRTRVDMPTPASPSQSSPASPAGTSAMPGAAAAASPIASLNAPLGAAVSSQMRLPDLTKRENLSSAMQIIVLLTVLSLAPAILLMMTCFTRIIIVLSLLRQALGTQQLPPNQVMIGLAMFMTFLVMGPTWQKVNDDALRPYFDGRIEQGEALSRAEGHVREFMIAQIREAGNDADADLFSEFAGKPAPATWSDVNTVTLVPAFMLSELKTAFLMGFKVYLPFLVIDMVISIVLISMGMMMLPPALIALPFKLLLFVLVDGWHLITRSLMGSFVLG